MNLEKIEKRLESSNTHIRIMCEWGYFRGTFFAPKDGYLRGEQYWGADNKEHKDIEIFGNVESALKHINGLNLSTTYEIDKKSGSFTTKKNPLIIVPLLYPILMTLISGRTRFYLGNNWGYASLNHKTNTLYIGKIKKTYDEMSKKELIVALENLKI